LRVATALTRDVFSAADDRTVLLLTHQQCGEPWLLDIRAISGHVFGVDGKRRAVWRAKYRLPDGRQVQRTIGRVWTERGRPPEGYCTAQAWLREVLDQAERGVLPGMVRTGRTFAERQRSTCGISLTTGNAGRRRCGTRVRWSAITCRLGTHWHRIRSQVDLPLSR
jgi:hypothetical protein